MKKNKQNIQYLLLLIITIGITILNTIGHVYFLSEKLSLNLLIQGLMIGLVAGSTAIYYNKRISKKKEQ